MKKAIYIIDAKRTAIGKFGGGLSTVPAPELMSEVFKYFLHRYPITKKHLDEVIVGNVLSAGLGQNPARIAAMKADISEKVPAVTVNKVCGSGLKSVIMGAQAIGLDEANLILAGGMENMSLCPYYLHNHRFGNKLGNEELVDGLITDGLFCSLIGEHMGATAENIAERYRITREEQDKFAYNSQQKALAAVKDEIFQAEIIPIEVKNKRSSVTVTIDEQPRSDTTLEKLSTLRSAFKKDGCVTAGNASTINDGAAAVLLASEMGAKKYKLQPQAKIISYATVGVDPRYMGLGAAQAALVCLQKSKLRKSQIGLWEINEAFASQLLAVVQELKIDKNKVNVNGGAIALGHPIGASGSRTLTTLLYELKRQKQQYGLVSLCVGGGQGIAMIIESI